METKGIDETETRSFKPHDESGKKLIESSVVKVFF